MTEARRSTLVAAALALGLACWKLWAGSPATATVWGATAAILGLVSAVPAAARLFHRFWIAAARGLAWANSRILLSLLYFCVITPVGVLRRLLGSDPLRHRGPSQSSYWIPRSAPRQPRERFERLF